jgi:hypothetical protein
MEIHGKHTRQKEYKSRRREDTKEEFEQSGGEES